MPVALMFLVNPATPLNSIGNSALNLSASRWVLDWPLFPVEGMLCIYFYNYSRIMNQRLTSDVRQKVLKKQAKFGKIESKFLFPSMRKIISY